MSEWSPATRGVAATVIAVILGVTSVVFTQAPVPPPPSTSADKAKELVTLLQARKLEAFAARVPGQPGRHVAVLHVPGVQLLAVSAVYEKVSDLDYRLYHKDFMNAYLDLRTGVLSKDRWFVEDSRADGLMCVPGKDLAPDSIAAGTDQRTFDGDFADPRRKNQKKISQDDYFKAFVAADAQYATMLGILLDELKKSS
jgi:hypothetical protein